MDRRNLLPLSIILAVVLCGCCAAVLLVGATLLASRAGNACADANLTPEEKANCGTHVYQLDEKLTPSCAAMHPDGGEKRVTVGFYGNTMRTSIHDWPFTRLTTNEYEAVRGRLSPTSNINRHVNTIRLTMSGFTENYAYEGPAGNVIDCWLDTYTLKK